MIRLHTRGGSYALCGLINFRAGLGFTRRGQIFSLVPKLRGTRFMHFNIVRQGDFVGSPGLLGQSLSLGRGPSVFFTNRLSNMRKCVRSTTDNVVTNLGTMGELGGIVPAILPGCAVVNTLIGCVASRAIASFRPVNTGFNVVPPLTRRVESGHRQCTTLSRHSLGFFRDERFWGTCYHEYF